MSRSTTAARLLVVSLPFAHSLPQIFGPFQLPNATAITSPTGTGSALLTTGEPEPAILVPDVPTGGPLIDPILEPIPIDPSIDDGFWPGLPPIPLITVPLDPIFNSPIPTELPAPPIPISTPPSNTVSVETFLDVVQNLLDLIKQLSSANEPIVPLATAAKEKRQWPSWLGGGWTPPSFAAPGAAPAVLPAVVPGVNPLTGASAPAIAPVPALVKPILASASSVASPAASAIASAVSSVQAAATVDALQSALSILPAAEALQNAFKAVNVSGADPSTAASIGIIGQIYDLVTVLLKLEIKKTQSSTVTKRGAEDALAQFYSALSNGQEPVQELESAIATVRESFHAELVKRGGYDDGEDGEDGPIEYSIGDKNFIKYYIKRFHYYAPTLFSIDPEIAEGLSDIFTDPTIPVPMPHDLDLDEYPDQLKQFVVETYIFESIITDPSVPIADKIAILQILLDGLPFYSGRRPTQPLRPMETPPTDDMVGPPLAESPEVPSPNSNSDPMVVDDVIAPVVSTVSDVVSDVTDTANDVAGPVVSTVTDAVSDVAAPVISTLSNVASDVTDSVSDIAAPLVSTATDAVSDVTDAVSDITAPVEQAVSDVVDNVGDIAAPAEQAVSDVVDNVGDVAAPAEQVVSDVVDNVGDVAAPAEQVVSDVVDNVSDIAAPVESTVSDVAAPVLSTVSDAAAPVLSTVSTDAPVLSTVSGATSGLGSIFSPPQPPFRRTMRRGRRTIRRRQDDEGAILDDSEKLGADYLNYITNGKGTLDPLGQTQTGYGGYQSDQYATDDYDYGYPAKASYDLGYKQGLEDYKKYHSTDGYKSSTSDYKADPPKDSYNAAEPYHTSSLPNPFAHTTAPDGYKPDCKPYSANPLPYPKHTTPQYVQDVVKDIYGTNGDKKN
ncbi:hypothetical protein ACN47E_003110 [Coniothyrium glycines]